MLSSTAVPTTRLELLLLLLLLRIPQVLIWLRGQILPELGAKPLQQICLVA
jgi:hypothetical protein